MSWCIERILSNRKIIDIIHSSYIFLLLWKEASLHQHCVIWRTCTIFAQNGKQMIKFDFPIIVRQRNISSSVPGLYKVWHWFHKGSTSLSIVTCLSHRIFKLELKIWVCGFLGHAFTKLTKNGIGPGCILFLLETFELSFFFPILLQSRCCHASSLLMQSVQIWSIRAGRWVSAVLAAAGSVARRADGSRVRAQTQTDAGIRVLPVCSRVFEKTTASAQTEKPYLPTDGNRVVLQLY